jgi:iron complex transport system substrate-binding protein
MLLSRLATRAAVLMLAFGSAGWAAAPPRRVVSLDLCTDWLLARYAPRERVAALSPLSRESGEPVVDASWPTHDGTIERILQFDPDLVVTGQYNALLLRERLRSLGLRVAVLPLPTRLADIAGYERRLLDLLGLSTALADAPSPPVSDAAPRKRLLLLGANGIGTGRGTLEDEVLAQAGWANYLPGPGYQRLDLERIAMDPPDAVLRAAPAGPALANRFAEHPVLKSVVPASRWLITDTWRWQCPGPWTWDLVRELSGAPRGEPNRPDGESGRD